MSLAATARVAAKWSTLEPDVTKTYFGFPPLRRHLISLGFGDTVAERHKDNRNWAEDIFVETYAPSRPVKSILSLCCGFGAVEQYFVRRLGTVTRAVGIDVAVGALETARARAAAAGLQDVITYEQADLNRYEFGERQFDLVIANGALHHLVNLEHVLTGIRRALAPGGILYANETVGPSYQDHPPRQLELINAVAYLVPPDLRARRPFMAHATYSAIAAHLMLDLARGRARVDETHFEGWKRRVAAIVRRVSPMASTFDFAPLHRSQKKRLVRKDPSEGVRSGEIIDVMRHVFGEIQVHPYGGAILTYALDVGFFTRFDATNAAHRELLDLLCRIEATLMSIDAVGTEHAILVART